MNNAFSAYKKQSVTTLTPGDVVVKLYMEAERQLNRASYYIPLKNYPFPKISTRCMNISTVK